MTEEKGNADIAKRIAELTEDLEELRSEKAVLLQRMHFPEAVTADSFRKEIRTLEDGLKSWKSMKPNTPQSLITLSSNMLICKNKQQSLIRQSFTKYSRIFDPNTSETPLSK